MLAHKNIIKFCSSFETASFVFMKLELAELRTLKEVSKKRVTVTEVEARYYFTQIAAGMKFLSDNKILHRDIKLGNLFLSADMTVKIGDFGLAIMIEDNTTTRLCGTPNYISPEVLNGQGHSVESDLWAVGCVIYALLCGNPPFHSRSLDTTYMLIKALNYKIPSELSLQAAEFLKKLLDGKPLRRGNLNPPEAPGSLLGHPFLSAGLTPARLPPSAVSEEPSWDLVRGQSSQPVSPSPGPVSPPGQDSKSFLERVTQQLKLFLRKKDQVGEGEEQVDKKKVPVFISKWVDNADRMGFVYELSNGGLGVLYNDGGMFAVSPDGKMVEFSSTSTLMKRISVVAWIIWGSIET